MYGHVRRRRLRIARQPNSIHGPQTTGQNKDNGDFFNIHRAQNSELKSRTAIATTNRQKQKAKRHWRPLIGKREKQSSDWGLQILKSKKQNCNGNGNSAKLKNKAAIVTANRQEQKAELQLQLQISK